MKLGGLACVIVYKTTLHYNVIAKLSASKTKISQVLRLYSGVVGYWFNEDIYEYQEIILNVVVKVYLNQ